MKEPLHIPGIRNLWIAQSISLAGDFLAIFAALSTASFRLHATPSQITGVTISYMLPLAILGPFAGIFADRWNPRRTMIASDLLRAALALFLIVSTSLTQMYAVLFAISSISTFFNPAQSITVRKLTPRDQLLSVNALFQQTMLLIRILCPALAGALVALCGPASCYGLDVLSFLISASLLRRLPTVTLKTQWGRLRTCEPIGNRLRRLCRPSRGPQSTLVHSWPDALSDLRSSASLTVGIRFILTYSEIAFLLLAMTSATFAISCSSPLLAVFVRDHLHFGVRLYGLISALLGVGMITGVHIVRNLAKTTPPRTLVLAGLAVISLGLASIALAPIPALTALGAFAMGTGVGLLTAPAQTVIQSETPVALLGRVSSAVTSLIAIAQIFGLLLSGSLAGRIGIRPIFFASAFLLAALATFQRIPRNPLTELNTVK